MADIQDFGKKIGGARKDLWKARGIMTEDLIEMNDMERKTHIKKDNIWLRPDWIKVVADGTPQCVAYWQNKMRQAVPPRPEKDDEYHQENYIAVVTKIRDAVMAVRTPSGIDSFYKDFLRPEFIQGSDRGYYVNIVPEADGVINNKVLKTAQASHLKMQREAEKNLFGVAKEEQIYVATKGRMAIYCYDDNVSLAPDDRHADTTVLTIKTSYSRSYSYLRSEKEFFNQDAWQKGTYFVVDRGSNKPVSINFETREQAEDFIENLARASQEAANKQGASKEGKDTPKRKGAFVPPQLRRVQRTGPDYRQGHHANSSMFLKDLKFRGGEFGNWLNENDRQASLDMAYDALRDLARFLQVRPEDISFDQTLAIAFGARGKGGSGAGAAHYEPDRQVINLTKMSGAGCLAHEWGHALDHAIGTASGFVGLASESNQKRNLPESFKELLTSLKYKTVLVEAEDIREEWSPKIERYKKGLNNWISSVKPKNLPEKEAAAWDAAVQQIMDRASTFTGLEYMPPFRRGDSVMTKPEIELLSQIRKQVTGHVIPKDSKVQIALWARDLGRAQLQSRASEPVERRVQTDFYKNSMEFDKNFSKAGHGYWQSDCEMFARAFDCYISDKIEASGLKSSYLSGHANSFVLPGTDGRRCAAFPEGEERKMINEKFDILIADIKERGILHDFIEPPVAEHPAHKEPTHSFGTAPAEEQPRHFEQMSFDDLLFNAQTRAEQSAQQHMERTEGTTRPAATQNRGFV